MYSFSLLDFVNPVCDEWWQGDHS